MRNSRQSIHRGGVARFCVRTACLCLLTVAIDGRAAAEAASPVEAFASAPARSSSVTTFAHLAIDEPVKMPEPITGGISDWAVPVPPAHEIQRGEPATLPTTPTRPGAPGSRRRLAQFDCTAIG